MMKVQAEVAIIGAGPTGLSLANELRLAGISVVVLERRRERVGQARAMAMHPRTVEVFELRGIGSRFVESGITVPTGHYAALPTRLDFTVLDTRFNFSLVIPQTRTEALLEERAKELGVDLRRGWSVEVVVQDSDGVTISGKSEEGDFTVNVAYAVGADGARSIVRNQAGIAFVGHEADQTLYFGDVRMANAPTDRRFQVENEEGFCEGFPIEDGRVRLIFADNARFNVPVAEPVTLEEMQDGARRIMGPDVELTDPSWLSRFGNESKLAARYRAGRIFLVGDAAHIHLPAGGQGMNTGIQDAVNLGWKLAGVLHGRAPEALLDSYERERRPVGQQLIDNTRAQSELTYTGGVARRALRGAVDDMLRDKSLNRRIAGMISAIDTAYPEPVLEGYDPGLLDWAGRRLPDADLRLADGARTRLYKLLGEGDWVDLRLADVGPSPIPDGIAADWIKPVTATLVDSGSSLNGPASILVRPDGHAAHVR